MMEYMEIQAVYNSKIGSKKHEHEVADTIQEDNTAKKSTTG